MPLAAVSPQLSEFHEVFSRAAVGVAVKNLEGRYVYVNDAFCRIAGYSREELLNKTSLSITHLDYRASSMELSRRLLSEELPAYVVQKEYVKKNGSLIWVKNSVSLLRDSQGKPSGVLSLCEDLSERRVIQSALEESEERFRVQFRATPVPIFSWRNVGDDFVLVDYNDAADRMTHRGIIRLLGRRASRLYKDTPEVFETMLACFTQKETIRKTGDFRFISTGEVKHLDVSFVYVPPDRVMIHTEDITERVDSEKARLEAERKFREIFENAHEGIFQTTPEGRFLTANPALARILGFDSAEQLIRERTNIAAEHYVNAERREEMKRILATSGFVQGFEFEAYRRDGERIWLSESVRSVTDIGERVLYYEGICEDITKRKRAESELRKQKEIFQEIFDHIPVMITFLDQDGRIKLVNQAFEATTGWTQEEIRRKDFDLFAESYPDEQYRDGVLKFLKTSNGSWAECQPLTKDGRLIDTYCTVVPLSDGTRLAIGKDITQEKKQRRVNAAATKLSFGLSGARTPQEAAKLIVEVTDELFGWDACNLQLYDNEKDIAQTILAIDTIDSVRTDVTSTLIARTPTDQCRRVLTSGAELLVRDKPEFDQTSTPFGDLKRPSASIMSVPIRYGQQVIGILSLHSYQNHVYSGVELNDLKFLADICGEALNRIRAEESLSESEERFRQIAENMDEVLWMVDVGVKRIIYINPAYEKLYGQPVSAIYKRLTSFIDSVHPDDRRRVEGILSARARGNYEPAEYRIIRPDNSVRWIRARVFPIKNADGITYRLGGTAEDITDEKRGEIELRNYSRRLMDVQERERKQIAQELHDEIGQVLTAVKMNLQALQNASDSVSLSKQIDEDVRVLDDALDRVRNLSFELRPSLLDDLGLAVATRWYVERYMNRAGIRVSVQFNSERELERVSKEAETACFRILQEALTNVARHAKAENVFITLSALESTLVMSIRDDGLGLDETVLRDRKGHLSTLGLHGMKERALAVGGSLEIVSAVGKGTEILAMFPLSQTKSHTPVESSKPEPAMKSSKSSNVTYNLSRWTSLK